MKIEPMHPDMEQYFNSRPDEVKHAESADKDMEHLQNIYGKTGDIKSEEKKELDGISKAMNALAHFEWARARDKKKRAIELNVRTIADLEASIKSVGVGLENLKKQLLSDLTVPSAKADIKYRITNTEKGYNEMVRLLGIAKAETDVIKSTEYLEPEHPYKRDIQKN
jgi:hypothetical protein